jgi:hypothetical protein
MACTRFHAQLSDALAVARDVPLAPVELCELELRAVNVVQPEDTDCCVMWLSCPPGVSARHVELATIPTRYCISTGDIRIHLSLREEFFAPRQLTESDVQLVLEGLARNVVADISFTPVSGAPVPSALTFHVDARRRSVMISIASSEHACDVGAYFTLHSLRVAGEILAGPSYPVVVEVFRGGMHPPLLLAEAATDYYTTPCITEEGVLFVPSDKRSHICVYDSDGTVFSNISLESFGLTSMTALAYHAPTSMLVGVNNNRGAVALRMNRSVLQASVWNSVAAGLSFALGIAILTPTSSSWPPVVVVGSYSGILTVFSLGDGAVLAESTDKEVGFLAYDARSEQLFVSSHDGPSVSVWCWNGNSLTKLTTLTGIPGMVGDVKPLAVMPPVVGRSTAFLLIGMLDSSTVHVLSLPSCTLVHSHVFPGMEIEGLAADPTGTALAICDRSETHSSAVHVVGWPLEGMPECD